MSVSVLLYSSLAKGFSPRLISKPFFEVHEHHVKMSFVFRQPRLDQPSRQGSLRARSSRRLSTGLLQLTLRTGTRFSPHRKADTNVFSQSYN